MNRRSFIKSVVAATCALPLLATGRSSASAPEPSTPTRLRTVEAYDKGVWHTIPWQDLKKNTIFRLREVTGEIVDEGTMHEICLANEDARLPSDGTGNWIVQCEPFTIITKRPIRGGYVTVMKDGEPIGLVQILDLKTHKATLMPPPVNFGTPPAGAPLDLGVRRGQVIKIDYVEYHPPADLIKGAAEQ